METEQPEFMSIAKPGNACPMITKDEVARLIECGFMTTEDATNPLILAHADGWLTAARAIAGPHFEVVEALPLPDQMQWWTGFLTCAMGLGTQQVGQVAIDAVAERMTRITQRVHDERRKG